MRYLEFITTVNVMIKMESYYENNRENNHEYKKNTDVFKDVVCLLSECYPDIYDGLVHDYFELNSGNLTRLLILTNKLFRKANEAASPM